jgi:class 3 adenylate cyclase
MPENRQPAGHPMDEIAQGFKKRTHSSSGDQPVSRTVSPSALSKPADARAFKTGSASSAEATFGPLSLSPDQIAGPAFFVDKQLSICWIAPDGADAFSQALALELASESTRNIFTLLLKPAVKEALSGWQAFFPFVYTLIRRSTSRDTFEQETDFVPAEQTHAAHSGISRQPEIHPFQVESCMLGENRAQTEAPLRLFGVTFAEGALFLIREDRWVPAAALERKTAATAGTAESVDEKKAICILSARLNDSHRIADTMLPEVFFKLMNRIWDEADGVVRSLGGIRAASSGAEIQYMFTKNAGRNPIFSAICCATRLNDRIRSLQEKLRAEQGWADEICMNIGISHGTDDLTAPEPADSMELMIPGGASDQSGLLSAIALKGEIWITKNAVGQLPRQLIDQVVMGVDRQGQFVRNFFTRLSDLSPGVDMGQPKRDMGALSIARIVKIEKKSSDQPITNED